MRGPEEVQQISLQLALRLQHLAAGWLIYAYNGAEQAARGVKGGAGAAHAGSCCGFHLLEPWDGSRHLRLNKIRSFEVALKASCLATRAQEDV